MAKVSKSPMPSLKEEHPKRRMRPQLHTVCYICGQRGYKRLLFSCLDCFDRHVHKSCLDAIPGYKVDPNDWNCGCCPSKEKDGAYISESLPARIKCRTSDDQVASSSSSTDSV